MYSRISHSDSTPDGHLALRAVNERAELQALLDPLMAWLAKNRHPHCVVMVHNSFAELLEGEYGFHPTAPVQR